MLHNPLVEIQTYEFEELSFKQLMQNRIHNVLIVCSSYDYYLLEEDGRIDEQIFNEYTALNLRYPPSFLHASSASEALLLIESENIDLVITWVDASVKSFEIASEIKDSFASIPIAALSHYSEELRKLLIDDQSDTIDFVFHWSGNINIFLAIIKLVEDRMNAEKDINEIGVNAILLVEDSLRFYSQYLPIIYKVVLKQTESFIHEGLNQHRKMISKRGRPKILLATNYEEGIELFEKYKDNLLGIISDVSYYKDGVKNSNSGFLLLEYVRKYFKYFPVLIQSSEIKNKKIAKKAKAQFLYKYSDTLGRDIKKYITKYFSFGNFEFWDPKQKEVVGKAKDLRDFQKHLSNISIDALVYHAKRNDFSKWLQSRALFSLARLFSKIDFENFGNQEELREFLIKSVRAFRIDRSRGVIAKFDKDHYDEYLVFSRIGDGALGGKGRGLAFIDMFLKRHRLSKKFKDVSISIPRTVVLSTDVFDDFMEEHDLFSYVAQKKDDEAILNKFISKSLPTNALAEIKAFLETSNTPIAIRSSSVLEDSLYQPFAGIFATYMVPDAQIDVLLEMVSNAIKSVMASAFYKNSKAYIKATSHSIEESKMAIILQEVIGKEYEDVYYPNISGVARSINVYPIGSEKSEEGIVNIALGLGEIIVGGGRTLRFSPAHPKKILQLSNPGTAQRETQKYFYGLDTNPESYHVSMREEVNKKKISLRKAKNHGSLKFV
ncbi:MAG TPA: phosphoenolpyruvate synthase, partial [Lutibacter sp.]|nr:phosphoenolpyruvate synthase [Lutibacter sp.]